MSRIAFALAISLVLLSSSARSQTLECSLTLTPSARPGDPFAFQLVSNQPAMGFVLIGLDPGPVPTKLGTVHVGFPFLLILAVPLEAGVQIECAAEMPCDTPLVGMSLHMQGAVFPSGNPGGACLTNPVQMDVLHGSCSATGTETGDFWTFTEGGWGSNCSGNNPGCLRDTHFASVFPDGLILGDTDGVDGDGLFALHFTTSAAVAAFLPHGGKSGALSADAVNPAKAKSAGVLAGQLLAASLNLAFDDAGVFGGVKGNASDSLGDLLFSSGVASGLLGASVRHVIERSQRALSGDGTALDLDGDGKADLSFSQLADALALVNENFDDGNSDLGHLSLP